MTSFANRSRRRFRPESLCDPAGNHVEQIGHANGYAVTIVLPRTNFGFGIEEVVPLDLQYGFSKNEQGMIARAQRTRQAIKANILGQSDAPNIFDGAVLTRRIGGRAAYFEADGSARRPARCST